MGRHEASCKRICGLIGLRRSSYYYKHRREVDQKLTDVLREKAYRRKRFGYRRLSTMLRREGWNVNHKKVYRIYCELGLQVRRRKRKKTSAKRPSKRCAPMAKNGRWSMDFVHDATWDGRKLRMLTIVDDFTRECLWIEADSSLTGKRVVRVLNALEVHRGLPKGILTDNGSEFTGRDMDKWACDKGVALMFIDPGKPSQNAYIESFNGKFRDECLNEHWFMNPYDARAIIEEWRKDYNTNRPHSSIGNMTPEEFSKSLP